MLALQRPLLVNNCNVIGFIAVHVGKFTHISELDMTNITNEFIFY